MHDNTYHSKEPQIAADWQDNADELFKADNTPHESCSHQCRDKGGSLYIFNLLYAVSHSEKAG